MIDIYLFNFVFDFGKQLAETLLKKETLNYDEVVELIGPPKFGSAKKKIEPVEFEQSLNDLARDELKNI